MAKKKQHVPVEESIEEQQERQRLNLSIIEMRLTIMLKEVTPENAPEKIAAFESSADISDDYKAWIVNVIREMTKAPKPFPIDRGLLLDMRREMGELVKDSRRIKYDLVHPPVSLADIKAGLRKLMSHLFDNFMPYLNLDERRLWITSYIIFQIRLRSHRHDFGVFIDGVDGLNKAFNSLLLRIEEEINLLAAKEQVRHLVADMRERLRHEAAAGLTDKDMNSKGRAKQKAPRAPDQNFERNQFIYEEALKVTPWKQIQSMLRDKFPNDDEITHDRVRQIASEHAIRHSLPEPPRRQGK
ncbi:hypothetical protein K2Y11_21230 [bacterium]|nr:hypothetical protein [bacterium]